MATGAGARRKQPHDNTELVRNQYERAEISARLCA
jgi:hypothetical protein